MPLVAPDVLNPHAMPLLLSPLFFASQAVAVIQGGTSSLNFTIQDSSVAGLAPMDSSTQVTVRAHAHGTTSLLVHDTGLTTPITAEAKVREDFKQPCGYYSDITYG